MNEILTYNDLLQEKKRLETELAVRKKQIRTDLAELRDEFKPVLQVMGKITNRSANNPLIAIGATIAGELLLKSSTLTAGAKISRLLAVLAAEKVSAWFLKRNGSPILAKLAGFLKRK